MTLPSTCKYEYSENTAENSFSIEDEKVETETQNVCNICFKKFTAKKNLLKHLRDVHKNYSEAERMVVKKIKCPERNCSYLCRMMKELRDHIEKSHKIKILKDTLQFPSDAVFQKWKKEEESNTVSWFVTGRKKTTLINGTKKQTLYCHRTGHYSPKGFGKYRMRSVGSCKIGVTCPAAMEVTESSEGELTVTYYKTHLGHMQDVVYLKLTNEERTHLAEKIKQGFSFDSILEDVKESRDFNCEKKKRIHLLSKKDLYSIMYRSINSSSRKSINKEENDEVISRKKLKSDISECAQENSLPVENVETEKVDENFGFCPSNTSSMDQVRDIQDGVLPQKHCKDSSQPTMEGVASQIVILSPDIDYSSIAEIILLSTGDATPTQPVIIPQNKLENHAVVRSETQTQTTSEILDEKTKCKSNLHQQLLEKLQKISELLPTSEYLTPKQFDLINAKLNGVLDIFSVANTKAKAKRQHSKKKELKRTKTHSNINTELQVNHVQQFYENPLIYAVYN